MNELPIVVATYSAVVGFILCGLRKSKGVSQSEIADYLELNVSTWSRIENGESALTIEQMALAAEFLGVYPSDIMKEVEDKIKILNNRGIKVNAVRMNSLDIINAGGVPVVGAALSGDRKSVV